MLINYIVVLSHIMIVSFNINNIRDKEQYTTLTVLPCGFNKMTFNMMHRIKSHLIRYLQYILSLCRFLAIFFSFLPCTWNEWNVLGSLTDQINPFSIQIKRCIAARPLPPQHCPPIVRFLQHRSVAACRLRHATRLLQRRRPPSLSLSLRLRLRF